MMFSYIACNQDASPGGTDWQTTASIRRKEKIRKFGLAAEILVIAGAITLLVLSQQAWPEGFWLTHSATFISSCVLVSLGSLDILIASIVALSRLKMSSSQQRAQSDWKQVTFAGAKDPHGEFKTALEKQGIDPAAYKLVIFRAATHSRPYLYGRPDATAPDLDFKNLTDDDPNNLSNYTPDQIVVVTFYSGSDEIEKGVMKDPFSLRDNQRSDFWNKCTYIHMNEKDLQNLKENQVLSDPIIQAIQTRRPWQEPNFNN